MKLELAPSILAADFSRLAEEVRAVEPFAGRIHVDVMDGHFVPNLSMGPAIVESLRPVTKLPLEVHLMVERPSLFVDPFIAAGADRIVFHQEVVEDPVDLARTIKRAGAAAGLALNPKTQLAAEPGLLKEIDLLIVMTVTPGFGGQAFMADQMPKVRSLAVRREEGGFDFHIEVDGGIDAATVLEARAAGATVFVAGNSIFRAPDPAAAAKELLSKITSET